MGMVNPRKAAHWSRRAEREARARAKESSAARPSRLATAPPAAGALICLDSVPGRREARLTAESLRGTPSDRPSVVRKSLRWQRTRKKSATCP
jgi:hypothetical protein